MLHARVNLITADPPVLRESMAYIDRKIRPEVENQPGSLGLLLLASSAPGTVALESFWASHDALRASEHTAQSLRAEVARQAGSPVTVERYRVSVFEQEGPLAGGEAARLTRMVVKPAAVDDVAEIFGDSAVPALAESPGFRAALLLADPVSGQLISQTIWRDPQARAASPSVATVIRADLLDAAGSVIRAAEDYSLVFSSARTA